MHLGLTVKGQIHKRVGMWTPLGAFYSAHHSLQFLVRRFGTLFCGQRLPLGKGLEPRPDAGVLIASGAFALAAGCLADGKVAASGWCT